MNVMYAFLCTIVLSTIQPLYGLQKPTMRRSFSDDITVVSINTISFDEMRENLISPLEVSPVITKKKSFSRTRTCRKNSKTCSNACTVLKLGAGAILVGAALYVATSLHSASNDLGNHLQAVVSDIQLIKDTFTACTNMIHVCTPCLISHPLANTTDGKEL